MGEVTEGSEFHVTHHGKDVIRMDFSDFFYKESPVIETSREKERSLNALKLTMQTRDAVMAVLGHPTVGDKSFLVTI